MANGCVECWKNNRTYRTADGVYRQDPLCAYHLKQAKELDEEPPAVAAPAASKPAATPHKGVLGFQQKKCHNPRCGKMFTPTGPRALYCSPECREDMTTSHSSPSSEAAKQEVAPKNVVQDVQHSTQKPAAPKADPPKPTATQSVHVPRGSNGAQKLDGFEVRTFRADEYRLPIGTKECAFPKLCEYLRGQAAGTVTTVNAADPTPRGIKLLRDKLKRVMKNEKIPAKVIQNQKEQHVAIIRN